MTKKHLHTVDSPLVSGLYTAIAPVMSPDMFFSGGMSAQLFLPPNLRRDSSDIDMNGLQRFCVQEFVDFLTPALTEFKANGYVFNAKKRHYTLDVDISNDDEVIILQYPKRSLASQKKLDYTLQRESAHAQTIPFEETLIRVISAEDLLARKLLRSNRFKSDYKLPTPLITSLDEAIDELNVLKEEYTINRFNFDPKESAKYVARIRLYADMFDIVAIANNCRLDKNYFMEAADDYQALSGQKEALVDKLTSYNSDVFR
ncbi:hypothetical protein K9M74_02740 [Candidatus Woesearchaeota archaeon]|nr:hypothetical protein [Candidatus Woesearchaeota archaeon]